MAVLGTGPPPTDKNPESETIIVPMDIVSLQSSSIQTCPVLIPEVTSATASTMFPVLLSNGLHIRASGESHSYVTTSLQLYVVYAAPCITTNLFMLWHMVRHFLIPVFRAL